VITLESIRVFGSAAAGSFSGELLFRSGLQVISADNAFGKSLSVTAIAWCLGAETVFGLPDNDPSCFPLAVRDEIELDNKPPSSVTSSSCSVTLLHKDGKRLRLTRAIKGDCAKITAEEIGEDGVSRTSAFAARYQTMQDETGGFQHFFFAWLGWPRQKTVTFKGGEAEIYAENLLPLFYIDQDEGWTDIQSLQVTRYGQQQIGEFAVEYLLGGLDATAARVAQLRSAQTIGALKEKARIIADRVVTGLIGYGWRIEMSSFGPVSELIARWEGISLRDILARNFEVDLAERLTSLRTRVETLRKALTEAPIDAEDASAPSAVSQRVIELKRRWHKLNEDASTSRAQVEQTEILLESLKDRLSAAEDLYRLKTVGIGRIDHIECPTCHRDLDPATFALTSQSSESIENHIEALKRDRDLLARNLVSMKATMTTIYSELEVVSAEFREAERALINVTSAVGTVREKLAQTAAELASAERSVDRILDVEKAIEMWQSEIDAWVSEARGGALTTVVSSDFAAKKNTFAQALGNYLLAFGHSAISSGNIASVSLNDQYTPMLNQKRLRSLGSASDQSRLIAAYTLALADASGKVNGLHPGLVILDEPLQQNPDPKHRERFLSFLSKELAKMAPFQVVIFTSLRQAEITQLRRGGVSVVTPDGLKFLKLETQQGPTKPVN
jgi:hypothetical protein